MPDARLVDVAKGVLARLVEDWPDPAPAIAARKKPRGEEAWEEIPAGRNLWVYEIGSGQAAAVDRSAELTFYRVIVVLVEKYDRAGDPPETWVDERIRWGEDEVLDKVGDATAGYLTTPGGRKLWVETAENTLAFDPDELVQRKAFWSEFAFELREVRE